MDFDHGRTDRHTDRQTHGQIHTDFYEVARKQNTAGTWQLS